MTMVLSVIINIKGGHKRKYSLIQKKIQPGYCKKHNTKNADKPGAFNGNQSGMRILGMAFGAFFNYLFSLRNL